MAQQQDLVHLFASHAASITYDALPAEARTAIKPYLTNRNMTVFLIGSKMEIAANYKEITANMMVVVAGSGMWQRNWKD